VGRPEGLSPEAGEEIAESLFELIDGE